MSATTGQLDRREWINDNVVDPERFARATDWLVEVKWSL